MHQRMRRRHRFGGPICATHLAEAAVAAAILVRLTSGLQLVHHQGAALFVAWKPWRSRSGIITHQFNWNAEQHIEQSKQVGTKSCAPFSNVALLMQREQQRRADLLRLHWWTCF